MSLREFLGGVRLGFVLGWKAGRWLVLLVLVRFVGAVVAAVDSLREVSVRGRCGDLVECAVRDVACSAGLHDGDVEVVDVAGHVRKWRVDCEYCGETDENWGGVEVPPLSQLVAVAILAYVMMPVYVALGSEVERVTEVSES